MKITTIRIDLAKAVFRLHEVGERGKTALKKQLKHVQVAEFFANLTPRLICMEACGSAHHWARKLESFGRTVKLIAPQFVKPYVKTNKNDAVDAEAICEAVTRPNMRFVPVKNIEQQSVLALHRVRHGLHASLHARLARPATGIQQRRRQQETGDSHHRVAQAINEVMARQVRPWLAQPALAGASRVRASDRGANQQIPPGTATKIRTYGCNLYLRALMN